MTLHCVVRQLLWYLYQGHYTTQSTPTPLIFIATISPTLQVAVRTSVQGHHLWLFKPGSVHSWADLSTEMSAVVLPSLQQYKQTSCPTKNLLNNKDIQGSGSGGVNG